MTYARYFVNGPEKPPYEFLFDIMKDPDQLTNLAQSEEPHPLLKKMRHRCDQLVADAGPSMRDIPKTLEGSKKTKQAK